MPGPCLELFGFGYKMVGGQYQLSAQLGYVEIGCDVEVGAGTTIDRGTYSATVVGDGTKIDNQVMIAHNCRIGRHNMICSQVGIAGSTTTGDYVVMAGQVGVRDHVHIGPGRCWEPNQAWSNDVPEGADAGAPAVPLREQKVQFAHSRRGSAKCASRSKSCNGQLQTLTGSSAAWHAPDPTTIPAVAKRRPDDECDHHDKAIRPPQDRPDCGLGTVIRWSWPHALRRQGYCVCGLGIKEHADPVARAPMRRFRMGRLARWVGRFASFGARSRKSDNGRQDSQGSLIHGGPGSNIGPTGSTVRTFWPYFIAGEKTAATTRCCWPWREGLPRAESAWCRPPILPRRCS